MPFLCRARRRCRGTRREAELACRGRPCRPSPNLDSGSCGTARAVASRGSDCHGFRTEDKGIRAASEPGAGRPSSAPRRGTGFETPRACSEIAFDCPPQAARMLPRRVTCGHRRSESDRQRTAYALEGDAIRCPFHGWLWNGEGRCIEIPYAKRIPPKAQLRSWRVVERNGVVFVHHDAEDRAPAYEVPEFPNAAGPCEGLPASFRPCLTECSLSDRRKNAA